MKVEVKDVSPVEKMLEVEIPAERVGDEIEEQYAELMRTAHVKGFRPGKAPRKIVERLFKDYIHQQVVKKLVEETMPTAMDRKQLKPVVEPVVDPAELKPGEAYAYTAHLEVAPAVELKEYKGLTVEHSDELVTDAQVDEAIQGVLENAATIRDPEPARPSRSDDQILAEAVIRELGLNRDIVNVNGGAIALGHPIGASGARILVTLIYEMIKRDAKTGLATLCIGGGQGAAMIVER